MDPAEPLDLSRVRRLLYLRAVDRWDVPSQEIDKSGGPRDGEPEYYIISSSHTAARIRIHHTRVIRFEGLEVDRVTKGSIGNWGDSVLQPVYDAIRDIDAGGQSLSSQLQTAVQSVYKIKGLHEQILAGNREFIEDWMASLELFRSHLRAVGLDADNEDLQYLARPLGDSVTVYNALMHRVAAAADMPVTELFGMSPSGLSTDDQSGTRRFYDKITAEERQGEQGRALDTILELITSQMLEPSLNGAEIVYSWPSLYSPTATEEAELTRLKADTAAILIGAGVLQPAEVRKMGAEMLAIDIETQAETEEVSAPTDAILDPTERLQQARLAIQSGLLHLPDTAQTFRPMLGLEPLRAGETETWFNLVKTSEGQPSVDLQAPDPSEVELVAQGDVLAQIRFRFQDQASRIADGRDLIPWPTVKTAIQKELRGLPAKENQRIMPYSFDQWELLKDDHEEFMSTRDPENYDKALVKRMGRTRAGLRADQIIRMVEQSFNRAEIAAEGAKFFEWRTVGDDRVRPAHVALDGKVFPIGQGDPTEGFPGDAHNCRCSAVPVVQMETIQGDNDDSFYPPTNVQRAAQRALRVRRQAVPSNRGMTAVGLARARDLANGRQVSEETVRRMKAYFDRHEVDKEGATWEEQGKGWQAWHGWGGDAGYRWARRIVAELEKVKGDTARLEGSLDVSPNGPSSPVNQEGDQ
jgi:phage-related protein (TIGR01555 family)